MAQCSYCRSQGDGLKEMILVKAGEEEMPFCSAGCVESWAKGAREKERLTRDERPAWRWWRRVWFTTGPRVQILMVAMSMLIGITVVAVAAMGTEWYVPDAAQAQQWAAASAAVAGAVWAAMATLFERDCRCPDCRTLGYKTPQDWFYTQCTFHHWPHIRGSSEIGWDRFLRERGGPKGIALPPPEYVGKVLLVNG